MKPWPVFGQASVGISRMLPVKPTRFFVNLFPCELDGKVTRERFIMVESSYKYGGRVGNGWLLLLSTAILASLMVFILKNDSSPVESDEDQELLVYCAAGVKRAVEEVAGKFEQELGVKIALEYASSGVLANKLKTDRESGIARADVYIPADYVYTKRAAADGLTAESMKVASWKVVFAMKPDSGQSPVNVDSVLEQKLSIVLCDPLAGVGQKTKKMLQSSGHWASIDATKTATFPTVTEAALAVKENAGTHGAFIWDSVARQFGLKVVELPELESSKADISVAVTSSTARSSKALKFARYLAAPSKGGEVFAAHNYQPIAGDVWTPNPKLRIDCGGVNREAIEKTIKEFQQREGCTIDVVYAGCGTLVGKMQTGEQGLPDLFMTCDASYLDMIQKKMGNPFGPDVRLSSTRIVMLVAKGNPLEIQSLKDLGNPGLRVGTTDPKASTLGAMSHQLIRETGQFAAVKENIVMMADTAHTLVQTMEAGEQLDVAMVYEANVQHLNERFEFVPLEKKYAIAVQNVAARKTTIYPNLASRLMTRLASITSRRRFEQLGFQWEADSE